MRKLLLIFSLLLIIAIIISVFWLSGKETTKIQSTLLLAGGPEKINPPDEFARATGPAPLEFPRDFGAHPDFQTEWWYYTGNLDTPEGRHFGYQLTFFRRALLPPMKNAPRASDWATDQAYMAHFALTDIEGDQHHNFERLARGAAGLAGAQADPYRVWLENWSVEEVASGEYQLTARQDDLALDLRLSDLTGPVLQGEQGYSRKGSEPGNASYYYSQPRLATKGTVSVAGKAYPVSGFSWKDHEYSTSALSPDQIGWDWFSVQLDDRHEIMVFQLRREDGSIDPFSSGTVIYPDGNTRTLGKDDFTIQVEDTWRSPTTGGIYPSKWTVNIPSEKLTLEILPYLPDQEMNVSYNYWEGAVKVSGEHGGMPVGGSGYVELTGYAGSMSGEF